MHTPQASRALFIAIATLTAAHAWGQPVEFRVIPRAGQPEQAPQAATPATPANPAPPAPAKALLPDDPATIQAAVADAVKFLLTHQENHDHPDDPDAIKSEWPYEGVYRVNGLIPMGYRIGGTSLAATCLIRAPGYADDKDRQAAVARAITFICDQTAHPTMSAAAWNGGYDVRGWGYTCALAFLLEAKAAHAIPSEPKDTPDRVEAAIKWALDGLAKTEIPEVGGWNYNSHQKGEPCPSSPFMTGPTLQALFQAKAMGYQFDEGLITRGLTALERCRGSTGAFAYAAQKPQNPDAPEAVPGAIGRMLVGEVTLYLAGRSDQARLRGALDAFLAHWDAIDARRAKPGTHEGPYHIAPYYFYYAHYYAAQAIELLPARTIAYTPDGRRPVRDADRKDYRRRLAELLARVRQADGSWNDRIFPRTASYGTAMSAMALMMPSAPPLARYEPHTAHPKAASTPEKPDKKE